MTAEWRKVTDDYGCFGGQCSNCARILCKPRCAGCDSYVLVASESDWMRDPRTPCKDKDEEEYYCMLCEGCYGDRFTPRSWNPQRNSEPRSESLSESLSDSANATDSKFKSSSDHSQAPDAPDMYASTASVAPATDDM